MGKKSKHNKGGASSPSHANGSATSSPAVTAGKKKAGGSPAKQPAAVDTAPHSIKETSEKIGHALERRKSMEEIHDAGILVTEEDVEKRVHISEQIEEKLESRPNQDEMLKANEHIINPSGASRRLSGNLASAAKDLEKNITSDKIDRHLGSRPDIETLEHQNVLGNSNVAPGLQSVQKKLQRKMSSDELSHRLDHRPDVQELRDQGIVLNNDGVAPSLQATQEKLSRQMNADRVNHSLEKRPSISELSAQGVLDKADTHMAPSLTATAKTLERSMVQNQVSHLLESRPDKQELVSHHIIEGSEATVAPLLQAPKHQLERQLKADTIARQLRKRPSIGDLEDMGIIDEGELGNENSPSNASKSSLSRRARYTLALKAASCIAADKLISADEKSRLKDLILSDDKRVIAAIECYELDQDIEEMLDTLYRVAKLV